MDFELNESQRMITDMIRAFGEKEIAPYRDQWDEEQFWPEDLFKKLGALGLMGVLIPEEYGGGGLSYTEYITIVSEFGNFICI